jgi:hypothetical protein
MQGQKQKAQVRMEGECSRNIMYSYRNGKMRPVEAILGMAAVGGG